MSQIQEFGGSCIETTHARNPAGYGVIGLPMGRGKTALHHRYVYVCHHKLSLEAISGLEVRHKCDNPPCINPDHLELGTHKDNMKDMQERGRNVGKKNNVTVQKLTEDQVREIKRRNREAPADLAKEFGVGKTTIICIVNGSRWTNVI